MYVKDIYPCPLLAAANVLVSELICQGVVAGILVQNTLKYLLKFGHVSLYLVIPSFLASFLFHSPLG